MQISVARDLVDCPDLLFIRHFKKSESKKIMAEKRKPPYNPEIKDIVSEGGEDQPLEIKKSIPPEEKEKEEEREEDKEIEDVEIPIRKSIQGHIIARQKRTIEKLRSKEEDEIKDEEAFEEEITPEVKGVMKREIDKAIAPLIERLTEKTDNDELGELLTQEPEAEKYEKRIRSYMKSEHYKGVPASVIYHHLAFDAAETTGSKKRSVDDTASALNRGGGRTLRPKERLSGNIPSVEDQEDMTDEEFENLQHKARTSKFIEK